MPTPPSIERIEPREALGRSEFRALYEERERPVVIAGGARHFPATQSWTPDFLSAKVGHVEVPFKLSDTNAHPNFRATERARMFARDQAPLGELFRAITQGSAAERAQRLFTGDERFLLQRRNGRTVTDPELFVLLEDVPVPSIVAEDRLYTIWGWFSGPGVRTWLHYDNNGCHNVNAQITGKKDCLLFPPSELPKLAPFALGGDNPAHNCSQIDVDAPDLARFPEFGTAVCERAELDAGDLLFIPAFWFHTFRHLGQFNSNVNFWYRPESSRPNPVATRQALLDLAAASGLARSDEPATRELLARLDAAAVGGV